MTKKEIQEEAKRRGNLTAGERLLKMEILLETHLIQHDKLTRYLFYPILVGMGVSILLSVLTLAVKSGLILHP